MLHLKVEFCQVTVATNFASFLIPVPSCKICCLYARKVQDLLSRSLAACDDVHTFIYAVIL